MVPVSLRLKNFMSYGADAPVLDFEQFQVACLSGNNGQGKSALLDAMTWSLWGEARKSSGSHKPDDQLLRIGAREMQVEFVFDVEGERYRVIRSYRRTASGKSSKPDLELHVLEAANGDFHPITGASMRQTQAHIHHVIGLDYDTFINSAFLLQGRSDEFTKKRPGERKEILARILDLGRYDRLNELAAARERDAKKAEEQAEFDIGRLQTALEPEPTWKVEHAEVEQALRDERARLDALRADEKALAERLAKLDALSREADGLRRQLDALQGRLTQHEQDADALRQRIEEAERLLAQRVQIQQDHERSLALQQERDALDAKNEMFRGLEKQLERREGELKDRINELERRLDKALVEKKSHESALAQCEAQLAEAPSVRARLDAARAARRQEAEMSGVRLKREDLEAQMRAVETERKGKREELSGRLKALEDEIQRGRRESASLDDLKARRAALQQSVAQREELDRALEKTQVEGQAVADDLHRRTGLVTAKKEELAEQEDQFARLKTDGTSICPTCGTALTPAHREEVAATFRATIAALRQAVEENTRRIAERNAEREKLLTTYRQVQGRLSSLREASEELATVDAQIRSLDERRQALAQQEAEVHALRRQLDDEAYGAALSEQHRALGAQRDALPFDEAAYERVRTEAAQVDRYEERLRGLEEVAGRKEQLQGALERAARDDEALRRQLDEGTAVESIQQQIQRLKEQLAGVGFDPQRFREVKQALDALREAGARMTDLVNAQQNHADWKQQRIEVQQRAEQVRVEREQHTRRLAEVAAELDARADLEARRAAAATACREVEVALRDLQVRLGQLSEKLQKAGRDRAQLKECRKSLNEARSQRNLYRHLRAAFGKHGIPSLIIEQTLPEIEDRANDLLERLTDGKMNVRLETLKDKKTGGTMETLEIKITDEQGEARPYETFSGGEGFRVNFALRIALSQLLAERSGVRVRTLVIDEGFGTQDQQGIQNLVEAIHAIQDDFDKILVITHLPALKEVFPVRIEVEKDPVEGSRFEVIGV